MAGNRSRSTSKETTESPQQMSLKTEKELCQENMEKLGRRLSEDVTGVFLPDVMSIVAEHNREMAFRLTYGHDRARLRKGSKVCMEAWGTVYDTMPDGRALIVLDADSHHGVIVVPPHTQLCPMGFDEQDPDKRAILSAKAQKTMKQARMILSPDHWTTTTSKGSNTCEANTTHRDDDNRYCTNTRTNDLMDNFGDTIDGDSPPERGADSNKRKSRPEGAGKRLHDTDEGEGDNEVADGAAGVRHRRKRPAGEGARSR